MRSERSTVCSPDDDEPEQCRQRDRDELQPEVMAEADVRHQASELRASSARRGSGGAVAEQRRAAASAARRRTGRVRCSPPITTEIVAGLLGHDDRDRVVLFGEAERRAVPRAEIAAHQRIDRQRQETRRRRDAIALDDDGAVVQRRSRLEDARQQVVGDHRVERNAAFDVVAQADLPLEDDDRARAARGQVRGRDDELLDRFVRVLGAFEVAEERRAAEVRERAPDVGLEQHDDREHDVAGQVADDPVDRLELQPLRQEVQRR